jgi:DNA-binding response OmpR family regulator
MLAKVQGEDRSSSNRSDNGGSPGKSIKRIKESRDERLRVLIIGEASPDDDLVVSFLREQGIQLGFANPRAAPNERSMRSPPGIVLCNIDNLLVDCYSKIRHARSYGAPVLCTIPQEEAEKALLISQLDIDDYIFRPYRLEELFYRMQVLLRRSDEVDASPTVEKRHLKRRTADRHTPRQKPNKGASSLTIDDREKKITIGKRQVRLTPKEYKLFQLLASEVGRVFSTEELIEYVWPSGDRTSRGDVQQYVHLLRKKIEIDPTHPDLIVTVQGFGYKLAIPHYE